MLSNSASSFKGVFLIMGLYRLAMLAFVIGLIFFIAWAIKNLKKDKLLKLSIVLMVVGVLACLLTMSFGGGYHYKYSKGLKSGIMMKSDKWDAVKSKAKDATSSTTTTTTKDATKATTTK